MKILLIRTIAIEEDLSVLTYNSQGIGLATELSKLGHECALVFYAKKGRGRTETYESDGQKLKIYHIEGKSLVWNAIYDNQIYDICKQYDIIQVSECDQIASWQIYKRFPKKTIIYHGPYKSKYTKKYNLRSKVFDMIFLHKANFLQAPVITKSYLAEEYLRNKGFTKIKTLGVGLNSHNFETKLENIPENIKKLSEDKADNKYILFIGAISKRKNLKFVIEILNDIVNNKGYKNYKLIIVGNKAYKEEKYYNECFKLIDDYGLKHNIINLKTVEQKYLRYIYDCSEVYVLPTQYDIFGMVYLEAMYFGIPIITTLCGGSSLLIEEGKNGYIRNCDNIDEWTRLIVDIAENEDLKERMSKNSTKKIEDEYLWSKLAIKFEKEYKNVLKNDKGKNNG